MKNLKKNIRVIYLGMAVNFNPRKSRVFHWLMKIKKNVGNSNLKLKIQKLAIETKRWVKFNIVWVMVLNILSKQQNLF
jgi:hypothetical protein